MAEAKRVLVIDDIEDISESVAELLTGEGYQVSTAANGLEALAQLRSGAPLPNLILLDLMMPQMDGYEFRAEQRRDARLASIPVLLMTAGGGPDARIMELDARGCLRKPFNDLETFLGTVSAACA